VKQVNEKAEQPNWWETRLSCLRMQRQVKRFIAVAMVGAVGLLSGALGEAASVTSADKVGLEKEQTTYAYVGSRTTKARNARGEGINVYKVDPVSGKWTHVQLLKGPQENPSYLAFDRQQKYLYSVHGDFGEVSSYSIDQATGQLTFLNMETTGGKNPVHLVADPSNKVLVVANYATGSLVTLPIKSDGTLGLRGELTLLEGKAGAHKTQQGSSHPHQVLLDPAERFLLVPDKGLDKVFSFKIDAENNLLMPAYEPEVKAREGAGTRHGAFHPTLGFVYVANELDSTVTAYGYNAKTGGLKPLQIVPTVPESYTGDNTSSGIVIAPSGKFLYVSNRGHDSVVVYTIDQEKGILAPVQWVASQGKQPRFLTLDPAGKYLYVANENSDAIVPFKVNPTTGKLKPTGQVIKTGSPVCIIFKTK